MRKRSFIPVIVSSLVLLLTATSVSAADSYITTAASAFNQAPVYVHPSVSSTLSSQDAQSLTQKISTGNTPIYIAVLPAEVLNETGGKTGTVPQNIGNVLNKRGTVGVLIASKGFYASSNILPTGKASDLAALVVNTHGSRNMPALLGDFVNRVQQESAKSPPPSVGRDSSGNPVVAKEKSSGLPFWAALLIVVAGLGLIAFVGWKLIRRSRRKDEEAEEVEAFKRLKASIQVDYDQLASLVLSNSHLSNASDDNAVKYYGKARERYNTAGSRLDAATSTGELEAVAKAVADGLRYMSYAEGGEPAAETQAESSATNWPSNRSGTPSTSNATGPTSWPGTKRRKSAPQTGPYTWGEATGQAARKVPLSDRPKVKDVPAPEGETTKTITTTTYSGTGYWWGGGLDPYGAYWGPGYYPGMSPWVNPILLWDPWLYNPYLYSSWAMNSAYTQGLHDAHYAHDYEEAHNRHVEHDAGQYDNGEAGNFDSETVGAYDAGGNDDGSYDRGGGGDFVDSTTEPEPIRYSDPEPVYHAPVYEHHVDTSPPDYGGGGGDFGGGDAGGFDAGGGGDF